LAKRVLIEITESAEMPDLAAADKAIQCLRQMGYRVGIDDFGAGAASLQYLHGLAVDFIKMDGALIQRLGKSPREDALLKSVLSTCAELRIETIAEWIDSPDKLQRCRISASNWDRGIISVPRCPELPKPVAQPAPARGAWASKKPGSSSSRLPVPAQSRHSPIEKGLKSNHGWWYRPRS